MSKRILVTSSLVLIVLIVGIAILFYADNDKVIIESGKNNSIVRSNALTMMYETGYQTGEYQVASDNAWPRTDTYTFNAELSRCENGSKIYWNSETNKVMMEATSADKCYLYFDSELITFNIAGIQYNAENGMTWEEWINSDYNASGFYIFNHGIFNSVKSKLFFLTDYYDDYTVYPENTIVQGNNYDFTENPSYFDSYYLGLREDSIDHYNILYLNESYLTTILGTDPEVVQFILDVNNGTITNESLIQTLINDLSYCISDEVYELTNHLPLMPFIYIEPLYDGILNDDNLLEISFSIGNLTESTKEIRVLYYSIARNTWIVTVPDSVWFDVKELTIMLEDIGPMMIMGIY